MLKFLILTYAFCSPFGMVQTTYAQIKDSAGTSINCNSIYFESGGSCGAPLSVNYEKIINSKKEGKRVLLGVKTGYGFVPFFNKNRVPILLTITTRISSNEHFEAGIGFVTEYSEYDEVEADSNSPFRFALTTSFMYKYQKKHNGFCFRIGLAPAFYQELFFYPSPKPDRAGHVSADDTQLLRSLNVVMPGISFGGSF